MKKLFLLVAASITALTLLSIGAPAGLGAPAEQKIGIVDLQKVFDKYYKKIRSTAALKQEASDMEKERVDLVNAQKKRQDEWQALIDKAGDQTASDAERAKSKKAAEDKLIEIKTAEQSLQEYDRVSSARLREKERELRDDIVKEIRGVLDNQARTAGYTLVLDVSGESANMAPVVLFSSGANDLTDNLIKELNASAPPLPADSTK